MTPPSPTLRAAIELHARLRPSPLTQQENRYCWLRLARYAEARGEFSCSQLTAETVLSFQAQMNQLAPATLRHQRLLLRQLLQRLEQAGWTSGGLSAQVLVPRLGASLPPAGLPLSQQRRLLLSSYDLRSRALVHLLCFTGARCGELLSADVGSLRGSVLTVGGKSGTRALLLPAPCRLALTSYLSSRGELQPTAPLLASRQGRLSRRQALESLRRCCERASIPRLTPHLLRHACAARWLSSGVPLALVCQQLGHRHPSTTLDHYSSLLPVDLERGLTADPLLQEPNEIRPPAAARS